MTPDPDTALPELAALPDPDGLERTPAWRSEARRSARASRSTLWLFLGFLGTFAAVLVTARALRAPDAATTRRHKVEAAVATAFAKDAMFPSGAQAVRCDPVPATGDFTTTCHATSPDANAPLAIAVSSHQGTFRAVPTQTLIRLDAVRADVATAIFFREDHQAKLSVTSCALPAAVTVADPGYRFTCVFTDAVDDTTGTLWVTLNADASSFAYSFDDPTTPTSTTSPPTPPTQ